MKKVYILWTPFVLTEQMDLFRSFIHANQSNESLMENLIYIIDHLEQFEIVDGEIDNLFWSKQDNTLIYCMDVRDLYGVIKRGIVIKKLRKFDHTYEIRINQRYYKHRILFQFNHIQEKNVITQEFFILSYGFSKQEEQEDKTDKLSRSNDEIKRCIIEKDFLKEEFNHWLGSEWHEF